jgi:hypothetical protein
VDADGQFNHQVHRDTSYTTRNMITAPIIAGDTDVSTS